jgi:short-subunit dehydrogenase
MPGVMSPEKASKKMLAAIARGREVYNFPLITVGLIKFLNLLPGWVLRRIVTDLGDNKVD